MRDGKCWDRAEKGSRMKLLERITMEGPAKKVACEQKLERGEGGELVETERDTHTHTHTHTHTQAAE